jgi:hypothetical protein
VLTVDELKAEVQPAEEIVALRDDKRRLRGEVTRLEHEYGDLRNMFADLTAAVVAMPPPTAPTYRPPRIRPGTGNPITAVCHLTDWHIGRMQPADEIEGFNSFDPDVAGDRARRYAAAVSRWVAMHRRAYALHDLTVLVTGDLISGDIHDELRVTNAYPVPVQVVAAATLLAETIAALAVGFKHTTVEFLTADNHARLTRKPQASQEGLNSLNYLVGTIAQYRLASQPGVTFNVHPRALTVVNVSGRRYLLSHGHEVSGWLGFPYYGIERKAAREALKRMNAPDARKFDRLIMGHWHAPLAHPWYWIGGSVSGTDAFDHGQGRHAKPQQVSWMIHPRHGEFDRTEWALRG